MKPYLHILVAAAMAVMSFSPAAAEKLVILHTNDTHSQIDPDERDGLGGIARRKVIIDSVRAADKNVMLIDAGDFVQGTLYFNLYRGKVEQEMMNALGYDLRILGNHEFDNGIDELADVLADSESELLATNYDLSATPLAREFKPFTIREFGDKTVGFIAINLDPKGMISDGNYNGLVYNDAVKAANAAAWWLKHIDKVDAVIAVTHIGYDPAMPPGDKMLAGLSEDIDVIIGGHSHDLIKPDDSNNGLNPEVPNADGRDMLVTQAGKQGKYVARIEIDLDSLTTDYSLIRVDSRLDNRLDKSLLDKIKPYRAGVDSLMALPVGRSAIDLPKESQELLNFASDFVLAEGRQLADSVDFAIVNKGGLRRGLSKGNITEGELICMLPFYNYVNVLDVKGKDLLEVFDVMARTDGNGVSESVDAVYDPATGKCLSVTVDGRPLDPDRTYRIATIDYLAKGGDYMTALTRGKTIAKSHKVLYQAMIDAFRKGYLKGKTVRPSSTVRMHPAG